LLKTVIDSIIAELSFSKIKINVSIRYQWEKAKKCDRSENHVPMKVKLTEIFWDYAMRRK